MPPLWALLALGCLPLGVGVNLQPQLASVTFATNNPTLTTVALEKPLCMFDSSAALDGTYEIYLYVLVDLALSFSSPVYLTGRHLCCSVPALGCALQPHMRPCPGEMCRLAEKETAPITEHIHHARCFMHLGANVYDQPARQLSHHRARNQGIRGSFQLETSSRNASVQDSSRTPLSSTFQQTEGGRTGPYKATAFDLTPCSDLPSLDAVGDVARASEILNAYLVRVGANGTCLSDPNFQGLCNPPLSAATEYRFKYVLVNMSTGLVQDQTLWSDPICTRRRTRAARTGKRHTTPKSRRRPSPGPRGPRRLHTRL
ncbi:uroplakin-3a isoform X2 [Ailuropoda melanoleuca]|uniref:uroplakin-3a isoform X2 n=1 Tax=Ailuropoda melanoleuca TaxID=9646 RepID=UPI0014950078|nr:uroplakin-3a isoform X2 [Ailuropoda melanoleuca]